jgi:ABC-type multidrug transport system fused ATPase/permease subunit
MVKTNTKKTLGYYFRASAKHKSSGFAMLLAMFIASVLDLVKPLYYKKFFDLLTSGGDKTIVFDSLIRILLTVAAIQVTVWFFRRLNNFVANYFESKVMAELNNMCFAELHRHSFSFFNNNFVGSLTKKVKWFVNAFEGITDRFVWNIMPLLVGIVFIFIVLTNINIWLGVGIVVWLIFFVTVNIIFIKFKIKYDIKRNELETKSTGILADTITNNSNVKLFNGYQREVNDYSEVNDDLRKSRRFAWDIGAFFDSIQAVLMICLELGVMFYAVFLWNKGNFSFGTFVLIQSYISTLMGQIWNFGNILRQTYQNLSDAEEMTEILLTPSEIQDIPGAKELKVKTGQIEFKDVGFNYIENRKILDNFNLTIAPRERLAIIGPSGAGKTTVIKLIFRMHDLNSGTIKIDNQDISKVTQESLWKNVSLVPQDPMLFHRTLKENIAYGKPGATDKEIIAASKAAHCHEFISAQEQGYDTYVGERGIKLSGGERQRVAIARAILRNAPILVLDEATSSLDSESEHLIQEALENLMKDKTVIVIAHRLSTIRQMDRIIVVDNGQVVEEGTHDDLSSREGTIYAKLWQLQAGGFIA